MSARAFAQAAAPQNPAARPSRNLPLQVGHALLQLLSYAAHPRPFHPVTSGSRLCQLLARLLLAEQPFGKIYSLRQFRTSRRSCSTLSTNSA